MQFFKRFIVELKNVGLKIFVKIILKESNHFKEEPSFNHYNKNLRKAYKKIRFKTRVMRKNKFLINRKSNCDSRIGSSTLGLKIYCLLSAKNFFNAFVSVFLAAMTKKFVFAFVKILRLL